ncbi:delta-sarcoglycan-like [Ostrinia furnacalis]|uniref:delta-sarcoglycan-like n=1 Tax=Ostrinia furnacalis TaxID=93504 RepID=UPI00103908A3|nr:delta-sarcoglycan-like [Ostrinia furnacalis]XP_028177342.1 delta-sarcoglycan-like [Ostrinia furnacalis]
MSVEDRSASTSTGVIRGWGCTPTGDPPPATVCEGRSPTVCLPAGLVRGWRRTCLYAIIVVLMVLVFLNIALTLWIISTLRLNANGIGPIKIIKNGIQLDGQAWVVDQLAVSTISSAPAQPVTVHSYRNFSVLVSEPTFGNNNTLRHVELAKLLIKRDSVVCSGRKFEVRDAHGASVFSASRDEVRVAADTLAVAGAGGVTVKNAIQAPSVRAPPGSDLQLESLTRRLSLKAPQSIHFDSRAGSMDMTSHGDIKFNSLVGSIKFDAPNIIISNLKEANVTNKAQKNIRTMKVYQLCVCLSGKLFLAPPDSVCASTDDDMCR